MAAQFGPVVEFLPFRCERIPLPIYLIEAGAFVGGEVVGPVWHLLVPCLL